MITNPKNKRKEFAQGLVEFALVVPILLVIIYGLLEVGRMLFIYSSVVTATRQAVRYGSVTGVNDGGIPRFQDCAGIRSAARNVAFINEFEDSDINIAFDTGPGTTVFASCAGIDFLAVQPQTGDRLLVSVSTSFMPIVPLVPLDPMTIESSSSRTILVEIAIEATPDTSGAVANTPTPTFTPTASNTPTPSKTPSPTSTLVYSLTPSNTPTKTYTPTITNTPTITYTPTATGTATNTPLPTGTPIECLVSFDGIGVTQNKMLLTVNNHSTSPITISKITIFYNAASPAGQGLTAIYNRVTIIWDGSESGSPITISDFEENISIAPGSSVPLKLFFDKNLKVNGTELISISFLQNGCDDHTTNQ